MLLAVPASLIVSAGRAEAILRYYIFDAPSTGLATVEAKGSLNLPPLGSSPASPQPNVNGLCAGGTTGSLNLGPGAAMDVCVGSVIGPYKVYTTVQSGSFGTFTSSATSGGLSSPGMSTALSTESEYFAVLTTYAGELIQTSTTYAQSLASLGFAGTKGLIGTYDILDSAAHPVDTIEVYFRTAPPVPTPAPLPLLGGSIAMAWSRLLRQRRRACA